jgi:hypothetical protein
MPFLGRRGSVLILVYVVLGVLLVLSSVFFTRIVSDRKLFDIGRERQEAFYLAEAAVDKGIAGLNNSATYSGTPTAVALGRGEYKVTVSGSGSQRTLRAYGYVPSEAGARAARAIEAIVEKQSPPNFFDNAIYSAGDVDLNGDSYSIDGKVIYADSLSGSTSHITDTVTKDPTISPLAQFDFQDLRDIAVAQGNLYDSARLADVNKNKDSYPADFWYTDPIGVPGDYPDFEHYAASGTPNVVYIEGDMVLNGNIGAVGGFFLVVGDVLTDPDNTSDATINGNGTVEGCIYTTGNFRINGGGGNLNVNGGVWAGLEARLNGNATVAHKPLYMDSIEALINSRTSVVFQLLSWREV